MEKIILDKIFSPESGLMDTQKAVPTTGPTNFCRIDRQKSLNSKWWKKETFQKKFFKKPSWTHGKQLWQFCRLFLTKKNRWFSVQVWKSMKKTQTKILSKQSYVLKLILRTRRMQFCQVDRKSFENIWQIFVECPKIMGEKCFWEVFF